MAVPVVILNDTSVDRHHGCDRVMRAIRQLCAQNGFRITASAPAHRDWRENPKALEAIHDAALVFVNGEGTLHHDKPQAQWLLEAGAYARNLGKPAVLLSSSWAENGPMLDEKLKDFAIVAIRESASCEAVRHTRGDVRLTGDFSLYLPHPTDDRARNGLLFTDSVLWEITVRLASLRQRYDGTPFPMFKSAGSPLDRLRRLRAAVSRTSDGSLAERWRALEHSLTEEPYLTKTDHAACDRLLETSLLITGRFHALCFALLTGAPFLTVETNTHKMRGVVNDCGVETWRAVKVEDIDADLIGMASVFRPHEVQAIAAYLSTVRARIDQLFADARALC